MACEVEVGGAAGQGAAAIQPDIQRLPAGAIATIAAIATVSTITAITATADLEVANLISSSISAVAAIAAVAASTAIAATACGSRIHIAIDQLSIRAIVEEVDSYRGATTKSAGTAEATLAAAASAAAACARAICTSEATFTSTTAAATTTLAALTDSTRAALAPRGPEASCKSTNTTRRTCASYHAICTVATAATADA